MGSTSRRPRPCRRRRDHPHTHGEHHDPVYRLDLVGGSSPYAWGAQTRGQLARQRVGIIPIRMGSTNTSKTRATRAGDHPHTHGEHRLRHTRGRAAAGSSPYAWGALSGRERRRGAEGIIPIRMGSTVLHRPFNHEFAFFSFSSHPPSCPFKNELEPCTGLCKCLSPA